MSCLNCNHAIGYHHSGPSESACTCKDCLCVVYRHADPWKYSNAEVDAIVERTRLEAQATGALEQREADATAIENMQVWHGDQYGGYKAASNDGKELAASLRSAPLATGQGALDRLLAEARATAYERCADAAARLDAMLVHDFNEVKNEPPLRKQFADWAALERDGKKVGDG